MREILFRGKRLDNGEWVEGAYIMLEVDDGIYEHRIATSCLRGKNDEPLTVCADIVDPETIGQYTGLDDKNGVGIFEGDIWQYAGYIGTVEWEENKYTITFYSYDAMLTREKAEKMSVIGNIYDNPELIRK